MSILKWGTESENAEVENAIQAKLRGGKCTSERQQWKMQKWKKQQ